MKCSGTASFVIILVCFTYKKPTVIAEHTLIPKILIVYLDFLQTLVKPLFLLIACTAQVVREEIQMRVKKVDF